MGKETSNEKKVWNDKTRFDILSGYITDMALAGAPREEIEMAVRYSMEVFRSVRDKRN